MQTQKITGPAYWTSPETGAVLPVFVGGTHETRAGLMLTVNKGHAQTGYTFGACPEHVRPA